MQSLDAIKKAVEFMGGQAATARKLSVPPQLVWQWVHDKRPLAAKHCLPIERVTNGVHTRYALRPDVFGEAANDHSG